VPSLQNPGATLETSQGVVIIRLFPEKAPLHVRNFIHLAEAGFYDGTLFHRVIPGFMVQGGDPLTRDHANSEPYGTGGNTDRAGMPLFIEAEFNDVSHSRGVLSMARASDPDSASSQFFIVVNDAPFLDGQYTAFGEVISGMDVVDRIVAASNADTSDPNSGGKPRTYQSLLKVKVAEVISDEAEKRQSAAPSEKPSAPLGSPVPRSGRELVLSSREQLMYDRVMERRRREAEEVARETGDLPVN
jgi:peptidyl-prolyl cis-trans isomerase B (cyclophilin B)